jgi:hypothetical protein
MPPVTLVAVAGDGEEAAAAIEGANASSAIAAAKRRSRMLVEPP